MMRSALLSLLLALPLAAVEQSPRLELDAEQRLVLSSLPPILARQEVAAHLTTGLTTTLPLRVDLRRGDGVKLTGAARVEIRYDLWDEVFHVRALGIDGRVRREEVASAEALDTWWQALRLVVLEGGALAAGAPSEAKVSLEVIPFSQSEARDTRRWFSDAIEDAGRGNAEQVGETGSERDEPLSRALTLLLATSIQRRALFTYRWTVPVTRPAPITKTTPPTTDDEGRSP